MKMQSGNIDGFRWVQLLSGGKIPIYLDAKYIQKENKVKYRVSEDGDCREYDDYEKALFDYVKTITDIQPLGDIIAF
jgi:hypothetical protein